MPTAPFPPGKMYICTWPVVDANHLQSTPVKKFLGPWLDKLKPKSKEGEPSKLLKIDLHAHLIIVESKKAEVLRFGR